MIYRQPDTVRIAIRKDEKPLYDLLVDLWTEQDQGYGGVSYDPALIVQLIERGTRPDPATRTNIEDQIRALHGVIDDPDEPGRLIGSIGVFIEPIAWFTREVGPIERWFYVRQEVRNSWALHKDLASFALWIHDALKKDVAQKRFPLSTGFVHTGDRMIALERLWPRMYQGRAKKTGVLYWIE